jgi:hypothetical protein
MSANVFGYVDPVHARQGDFDYGDIGLQCDRFVERLFAVGSLANDL